MAFLMMVSVMRHTQSTVKFWFIANFLSPSFRAFIPHLAQGALPIPHPPCSPPRCSSVGQYTSWEERKSREAKPDSPFSHAEYGFDYELVTYKWPHWLRPQKEKQRTIWGYKILFRPFPSLPLSPSKLTYSTLLHPRIYLLLLYS